MYNIKLVTQLINYRNHLPYARHYKLRLVYFFPVSKDHFFVFKEVFSEYSVLMYGLYSRAAYDGVRTVNKRQMFSFYFQIFLNLEYQSY